MERMLLLSGGYMDVSTSRKGAGLELSVFLRRGRIPTSHLLQLALSNCFGSVIWKLKNRLSAPRQLRGRVHR